jgi:hypothetical protein
MLVPESGCTQGSRVVDVPDFGDLRVFDREVLGHSQRTDVRDRQVVEKHRFAIVSEDRQKLYVGDERSELADGAEKRALGLVVVDRDLDDELVSKKLSGLVEGPARPGVVVRARNLGRLPEGRHA